MTSPVVLVQSGGPNIVIRILWFLFVGFWLGGLVSLFAWLLLLTIIGLPLGLYLINRLPTVMTLRPQEQHWHVDAAGNLRHGETQRPFWLRAVYFLLIGWWMSAAWMAAAYGAVLIVIGLPLAFWMYGRVGAVTTLYRS
jgi:uncharacterized membrane protein YccF (DUF307 family)